MAPSRASDSSTVTHLPPASSSGTGVTTSQAPNMTTDSNNPNRSSVSMTEPPSGRRNRGNHAKSPGSRSTRASRATRSSGGQGHLGHSSHQEHSGRFHTRKDQQGPRSSRLMPPLSLSLTIHRGHPNPKCQTGTAATDLSRVPMEWTVSSTTRFQSSCPTFTTSGEARKKTEVHMCKPHSIYSALRGSP